MADDIAFNRDFDIIHDKPDQVSPLVRRVVAANPSHFTFKGTCSYIVGSGEVAVIDPGPMDKTHVDAILAALGPGGERVTHILVTHTHKDHSPGARLLKAHTGASVYAFGPHRQTSSGMPGGAAALDAAGDMEFEPDVRVAHGDLIEAAGFSLECVFTPGHTANHMAFALRQERALFSGDHVMGWSTSVIAPPDGNMADYMASLELLTGRSDKVYWPGHGGPVAEPGSFVRAFIAHRRMREAAILRRLEAGDRTIAEIVRRVYESLPQNLFAAASLSVLAHLQDLAQRGIVVSDGPPRLDSAFRIAGTGS
ncbi:MAG: MBL fold metallo-hydrolase [Hyphomicrobiales bacterium]|nr:MBL fold metallo-hydrolase [Hyphomicrobiales bacterium]